MLYLQPNQKRSVGQGVKTPPFHGGITGSIPVRSTLKVADFQRLFFIYYYSHHTLLFLFTQLNNFVSAILINSLKTFPVNLLGFLNIFFAYCYRATTFAHGNNKYK